MQRLITRQARLPISFLAAVLLLIGVTLALPACSFSNRNCGIIIPPDVSVQVANGITYLGALGSVMAMRSTDGSRLWQTTVGGDASPMTLDNGMLYVVSGATLTAIRASDGKHLWQFQGAASRTSLLVAHGTVYVASSAAISAVHTTDGTLLWSYTACRQYSIACPG